MRDRRVYIAAPYTNPDSVENTHKAILVGDEVIYRTTNWLPFIPHLYHLWHLVSPHPYNFWMGLDLDWMRTCHALVRVGGVSKGADKDMDCAVDLGIPVFLSLDEFITWTKE